MKELLYELSVILNEYKSDNIRKDIVLYNFLRNTCYKYKDNNKLHYFHISMEIQQILFFPDNFNESEIYTFEKIKQISRKHKIKRILYS